MPGMRDIKRKISSVKNTQKITKAMKDGVCCQDAEGTGRYELCKTLCSKT